MFLKNNKLTEEDFIGYMSFERKTSKGVVEVPLIEKGCEIEIKEGNKL